MPTSVYAPTFPGLFSSCIPKVPTDGFVHVLFRVWFTEHFIPPSPKNKMGKNFLMSDSKLEAKVWFWYRNIIFPRGKLIVHSMTLTGIDYGDIVYMHASTSPLKPLESFFSQCTVFHNTWYFPKSLLYVRPQSHRPKDYFVTPQDTPGTDWNNKHLQTSKHLPCKLLATSESIANLSLSLCEWGLISKN